MKKTSTINTLKAIKVEGFKINLIDVENEYSALQNAVDGKPETIKLRDGGIMLCDRDALPKDKPYNNIASLIAGTSVYGAAIILGYNGMEYDDVPQPFITLLYFDGKRDDAK